MLFIEILSTAKLPEAQLERARTAQLTLLAEGFRCDTVGDVRAAIDAGHFLQPPHQKEYRRNIFGRKLHGLMVDLCAQTERGDA